MCKYRAIFILNCINNFRLFVYDMQNYVQYSTIECYYIVIACTISSITFLNILYDLRSLVMIHPLSAPIQQSGMIQLLSALIQQSGMIHLLFALIQQSGMQNHGSWWAPKVRQMIINFRRKSVTGWIGQIHYTNSSLVINVLWRTITNILWKL